MEKFKRGDRIIIFYSNNADPQIAKVIKDLNERLKVKTVDNNKITIPKNMVRRFSLGSALERMKR
jgi:hypothetical protein